MRRLWDVNLIPERSQFLERGACCVRGVFDAASLALVADGIAACIEHPSGQSKTWTGDNNQGRFFQDGFAWERFEPLRRFVFESPAARLAAALMGSERVHLYMDHMLVRDPNTDKPTPWHHDTPYCFVEGRDFCTIWLPIDPVPFGEGLRLVSGSHRWGRTFLPVEFGNSGAYAPTGSAQRLSDGAEIVPDIDASPEKYEILSWDMKLGDCVVFYSSMLHSASAHLARSGQRRVYSTRWTGDDARYALRTWSVPPLPRDPGLKPGEAIGGTLFPRVL